MNRRSFVKAGGLGLGVLGAGLPNIEAAASKGHTKSVIFIFLAGGMTHAESFNAAPDAVDRAKSVTGYLQTRGGNYIGGNWENLAKNDHLFSMVHSFGHVNAGHQGGTVYVHTGYNFNDENPGAQQTHPSFGSIINRVYGANDEKSGIPNYVATGRIAGQSAAFLGAANNPFSIDEEGKKSLTLNVEEGRFVQRYNALRQLDNKFSSIKGIDIVDAHKKQAYDIMFGASSKVFDLKDEKEVVLKAYGNSQFGKNCILARRLVEGGSKFVTITHGGWDMHSNIKDGMDRLVPEVDTAIASLLLDLKSRGLLESTLVVVSTEFGRTLIDNQTGGRHHFPHMAPLLIAGSRYSSGSVIGTMDKNGFEIKSDKFTPVNLLSTILHHMDIPLNTQFTDFAGRPRFLVDGNDKRIIS